jgi:hypothetical protein
VEATLSEPTNAAIKHSVDSVAIGMSAVVDTLATHTDLLEQILDFAAEEPPASDLSEIMRGLLAAVHEQSARIERLTAVIVELPENIARALADGEVQ